MGAHTDPSFEASATGALFPNLMFAPEDPDKASMCNRHTYTTSGGMQLGVSVNGGFLRKRSLRRPRSPEDCTIDSEQLAKRQKDHVPQSFCETRFCHSGQRCRYCDQQAAAFVGPTIIESHKQFVTSGGWRPKVAGKAVIQETTGLVVNGEGREIRTNFEILDVPREDCLHSMKVHSLPCSSGQETGIEEESFPPGAGSPRDGAMCHLFICDIHSQVNA